MRDAETIDKIIDKVREMHEADYTNQQISYELDISEQEVCNIISLLEMWKKEDLEWRIYML